MTFQVREEVADDLLSRGYSRRQMLRTAMMFSGAATALAMNPEIALAQDDGAARNMIRIGLNECWVGPMAPGAAAAAAAIAQSNRYAPNDDVKKLIKTIAMVEKVPEDHVSTWPGSNECLARAVASFCSPTRGLVQADPTYDTPNRAAKFAGIPVAAVPLTADYRHDVKAMLAANPNAGLYYIVNPNNPTGTMTPMSEIEWLVDNKPAGSVVVIDEAYIHFSKGYPNNTASHLAAAGKEVLVMRTFSKVFGMAGMRLGYFMGRPEYGKKLGMYDQGALSSQLPIPSVVCGTASLTATDLINARRKELTENRAMTVDYLTKRGLKVIGPSEGNMIMVDWKTKSAKEMGDIYRAQGIQIAGPRWPSWPTVGRVSIGTKAEMEAFCNATGKILA